jgi:hypothetical protein
MSYSQLTNQVERKDHIYGSYIMPFSATITFFL